MMLVQSICTADEAKVQKSKKENLANLLERQKTTPGLMAGFSQLCLPE